MKETYRGETVETERQAGSADHSKVTTVSSGKTGVLSRPGVLLALLALYLIWGSTYLGMRLAVQSLPAFTMSGIRFVLAGTLLYTSLRVKRVPNPSRAQWLGAAVVGILLVACGNGGVALAEQWGVASGLAAVGVGATPLWAALFIGLLGRWPARLEWVGLALGFAGVLLLNLENGMWTTPAGAISLLLAPMCWALGTALSSRLSLPTGLMSSAVQMLAGGVLLLIVGQVLLREPVHGFPSLTSLAALAYLIIFGSLVAFSAYTYLLRQVRPALATSYAYVNPVVAVVLGASVAGERITLLGILAMVVILSGVGLLSLARNRR
ncbi:MAG: drug/metabolite exporter YedA [Ktedonobacteraceae bacterium]|nr:drug/metabolite exporter YedA [Ktedonobacteraceae bacterium]